MCHSSGNVRKINSLYEGCLRIVSNDKQSSYSELSTKDDSISVYKRNLRILATETNKLRNYLPPPIVKDIFVKIRNPYNLRQLSIL